MAHQHSSQDLLFAAVSVLLAVIGSFAALVSAMRIPSAEGRARLRWTMLAAVSLGGGAVWSMHFIGMIGYQVADRDVRYDLPLTGLSLLIAIAVSAVGLSLVARRPDSPVRLAAGGVVAGLGVAAMHYTGMAAMHVGSDISYRHGLVALSVGVAIVAALAALWIAFRVLTGLHVVLASLVMAVAVCGMHYTAMAATQVQTAAVLSPVTGADPITLAMLVCVIAFSVLAVVIFAALGGVTYSDPFAPVQERSRHRGGPRPGAGRVEGGPSHRERPGGDGRVGGGERPEQADRVGGGERSGTDERAAWAAQRSGPLEAVTSNAPRDRGHRPGPAGPAGPANRRDALKRPDAADRWDAVDRRDPPDQRGPADPVGWTGDAHHGWR
ncbi:MHYT domain-containing protein [Parafrankia sp. Ea1.12]|uniref:MHYT domain-containing protein n=1 Tax=Parafrankia sp. Ea1.12 TaxID=573499 RepID=UPI001F4564CB|nr:MHYT domain-containing protein [Parafrankia sp. Ea1.12]